MPVGSGCRPVARMAGAELTGGTAVHHSRRGPCCGTVYAPWPIGHRQVMLGAVARHLATACHDVRQERVAVMRGSRYEVTGREAGTRSRGRDGQDIAASAWADCCS